MSKDVIVSHHLGCNSLSIYLPHLHVLLVAPPDVPAVPVPGVQRHQAGERVHGVTRCR